MILSAAQSAIDRLNATQFNLSLDENRACVKKILAAAAYNDRAALYWIMLFNWKPQQMVN